MTDQESDYQQRSETAFHEAGHAIGWWMDGREPCAVRIFDRPETLNGIMALGICESGQFRVPFGASNLARIFLSGWVGQTYCGIQFGNERRERFASYFAARMAEHGVQGADGDETAVPDDDFGQFWKHARPAYHAEQDRRRLQRLAALPFEQFAAEAFDALCEEMWPFVDLLEQIAEELEEQGSITEERMSMWYSELDKAAEQISAEFESSRPAPATAPV